MKSTLSDENKELKVTTKNESRAVDNLSATLSRTGIMPRAAVLESQSYDAPMEGRLDAIRLDFNECTSPIAGSFPDGMPGNLVSTYPEYGALLARLAQRFDLDPNNFVLTNGSDEAISLISNTFIEGGQDEALISNPCFFMIKQCLKLAGAKLLEVSVDSNLNFDINGIEEQLNRSPKLAMFATPDNPTGSVIPTGTIESWCAKYPEVLFVIDEAYGEYAGTTVIPLTSKYENLLVLKTFSKAWGMAGFRLGMVVGNSRLTEFLKRVKLPYSVNSAAVFTALRLLEREDDVVERVQSTLTLRSRLASYLKDRAFSVRETEANWCLVGAGMLANQFARYTASKNVLVRNRSTSEFGSFAVGQTAAAPNQTIAAQGQTAAAQGQTAAAQGQTAAAQGQTAFQPMWGLIRVSAGNADEISTFEKVVDQFRNSYALIFDLDGTLVDTSKSFDQTVAYLVEKYSGKKLDLQNLDDLRLEGGFNDDWVASRELLKRRGIEVPLEEIAREGERYYLSIAANSEELLLSLSLLEKLRQRHPLYIVTGRTRREYAPVWGDRLDKLFDGVYCVDDVPGLAAKPSPDYLLKVLSDSGIANGAYIGNAVDDMQAARSAGLTAIGVAVGDAVAALEKAGAQAILSNCAEVGALLMVPETAPSAE
jgi:histidinol-phosphate aminotransferase